MIAGTRRAVAGLALALLAGAVLAKPPDFPAPPKAVVASAGRDMVIHGRSTSVRMFSSADSVEEIFDFYKDIWDKPVSRNAPAYAQEDEMALPWRVLTRVEDGYVMTVQARPEGGGSSGYLAISRLNRNGEPIESPAPAVMHGSEVLSNISHKDPGKDATTVVARNENSVQSNVAFYRSQFDSWRTDMDLAVATGRMHAMRFTRGRRNVNITIHGNDSGSEIVINEVTNGILR